MTRPFDYNGWSPSNASGKYARPGDAAAGPGLFAQHHLGARLAIDA